MDGPVGFIGLGSMGGPMARNLLHAGYELRAYDTDGEKLRALTAEGAHPADSAADVARRCDVVLTSLPYSRTWVEVAEGELLPAAREGQVFIDLGTVAPPEMRRVAAAFAKRGAALLDVPVSGGPRGAAEGTLRMFAGGDEAVYARSRELLEALGDPRRIVYCGPTGAGQVVKAVNQLASGLTNAACLECLALAELCGVDLEAVDRAVGGEGGWRGLLSDVAGQVLAGRGEDVGVKHGQLAHYLSEADERGFDLPLTRALHGFCEDGERVTVEANRPSPSFWRELLRRGGRR
jgi:3-hydroxyisobutyrate dehydrogenase-like beta-hydroxyacid dehydrogenase